MNDSEEEFHRCEGCFTERVCRYYPKRGLWLCTKGPGKCWRRRAVITIRK